MRRNQRMVISSSLYSRSSRVGYILHGSTSLGAFSSPTTMGDCATRISSNTPSERNIRRICAPPSTIRHLHPIRSNSSATLRALSVRRQITRVDCSPPSVAWLSVKTMASPSGEKNFRLGSSAPLRVIVMRLMSGDIPRAMRSVRINSDFMRRLGLSRRRVSAPTNMASHSPRRAYTSSQSLVLEITSRCCEQSSRHQSDDIATDSTIRIFVEL